MSTVEHDQGRGASRPFPPVDGGHRCFRDQPRDHYCADCGCGPRDGVRLRELRLLTDPPGSLKHLCADGPDADACVVITRARARLRPPQPRPTLYVVQPPG